MTAEDKNHALVKTSRIDEIGEHTEMPNKGWTFNGDDVWDGVTIGSCEEKKEKVLGMGWIPKSDMVNF